ncbi:MAG: ComF family protein [Spirochaetota bacterium]|nr:MAG: ComF family protein [Spirochaetota bacterium]
MGAKVNSILEPVLSLLFPNRCAFCQDILDSSCCICDKCLIKIEFIHPPFCEKCGAPLFYRESMKVPCYQCQDLKFDFEKNESLGVYTESLKKLIHLYKFNRRRSLNRPFTILLIRYKKEYIKRHDFLIPVPLNSSRYSERGFNQSSLITDEISRHIEITCLEDCLKRTGASRPQSSIHSRDMRLKNLTDRFRVREKYKETIRGKNILVFDDVLTTGATSSACAKTLYNEGAGSVDILTLARAVKA